MGIVTVNKKFRFLKLEGRHGNKKTGAGHAPVRVFSDDFSRGYLGKPT